MTNERGPAMRAGRLDLGGAKPRGDRSAFGPLRLRARSRKASLVDGRPRSPVFYICRPALRIVEVTGFEELLLCPFRFFANRLLKLELLEEVSMGIEPSERGTVIHRILKEFTSELAITVPDWPEDEGKAEQFLRKTVDSVLAEKPENAFWKTERLRLLGDEKSPGLLTVWLEEERIRAREGWRFETAEEKFEELSIGGTGITLKGRVDRVDHHPEKGRTLWDYKTGEVPTRKEVLRIMVRPQLPAYLLSLKRGLLRTSRPEAERVETGYIALKRAGDVKHLPYKDRDWEGFFSRWEEWVKERLKGPLSGFYPADPKPRPTRQDPGACKNCPYPAMCGLELQSLEDDESEEFEGAGE